MKMLSLLLATLLLCACASINTKVSTDTVPGVDFSRYHSFTINAGQILAQGYAVANSPTNQLIADTITQSLTAKGLTAKADHPDLLVNYVMGSRDGGEMEKLPATVTHTQGSGWETQGPRIWYKEQTQGGLIIEVRDAATTHLVWRAFINGDINAGTSSHTLKAVIRRALADYPSSAPAASGY